MALPCLTRHWVAFQRQLDQNRKPCWPKRMQREGLWSPAVLGTKPRSSRAPPLPASTPTRNQRTRTSPEPEYWNPFISRGSVVQGDVVLMPLHHEWPSSKVLHLKLALSALPRTCSPNPLNTLNLVQWARWICGTVRSPIFSVGVFSINKTSLTPNSDVLNFDLLRHQTHRLWFGNMPRCRILGWCPEPYI